MAPDWSLLLDHSAVKIVLVIILSGVIGYEREISNKPAGLRTNILIGLGSALMMMISIHVAARFGNGQNDPARIAAQVLTGIGFLGAGTIMQARGSVVGLTTAATIWAVAGVGLAVGSGLYGLAVGVTTAILLVLWLLGKVEKRKLGKRATECLLLRITDTAPLMKLLHQIYADTRVRVEEWDVQEAAGGYTVRFSFQSSEREREYIHALLRGAPWVERVEPVSFRIPE